MCAPSWRATRSKTTRKWKQINMEHWDISNLPNFVKEATISDLEAVEEKIMSVYGKLAAITKAVQGQKYSRPKNPLKVVSIVSRTATSALAVKKYLADYEDKIKLDSYFSTLEEIVSDLEINVVANEPSFYNPRLLKHYQKVVNVVLIETKVKDIINYCMSKLHNEVVETENKDET